MRSVTIMRKLSMTVVMTTTLTFFRTVEPVSDLMSSVYFFICRYD